MDGGQFNNRFQVAFKQNWQDKYDSGQLNPHGGTIALGHPLAATGTRVILNALYEMKQNSKVNLALATACAAGGTIVHTQGRVFSVTMTYDGSAVASWATAGGRSGTVNLKCGGN